MAAKAKPQTLTAPAEIKDYIRNPHKFNINGKMDGQYYNLWSTDNDKTDANDDVVIKSVYDPSPVGYSLPASNAFTGFTTTGQNAGDWNAPANPDHFNAKFPFDKGWYFYTKLGKQGETVFFPASGYRSLSTGSLSSLTTYGDYWAAGPYDTNYGRYLYFGSGHVYPLTNLYRSYGFPVRSAEEKCVMVWLR